MISKGHYHFIGIGGIGMSGVALALLKKGFTVSGSDRSFNERINELEKKGAIVFKDQKLENIKKIAACFKKERIIIVTSSAIKKDNEELSFCTQKNFVIKHRSEILASIMKSYISISVAGTHGKTSTSTFLATLLDLCTNNSSSIIGGILPIYESNSHVEDNKYLVTEIDESDGTTKNYNSSLGIINNIDYDHCDYYSSIEDLIISFKHFASNSNKLLINNDCKITKNNIKYDYSFSISKTKNINYSLIPKVIQQNYTIADYYELNKYIKTITIPIPGLHNLSNILAAIAACRINNISFEDINKNFKFLKLPKKRFEYRGELSHRIIIDDYAHHPNEIKETIKLARLFIGKSNTQSKRLVIIFQPHRYSRVNKFFNEFICELSRADLIIVTSIYSAGELNIYDINSQKLKKEIYKINKNIIYLDNYYEIKKQFFNITRKGDFILNMGAGDCHNLWSLLTS